MGHRTWKNIFNVVSFMCLLFNVPFMFAVRLVSRHINLPWISDVMCNGICVKPHLYSNKYKEQHRSYRNAPSSSVLALAETRLVHLDVPASISQLWGIL
jgi:hypothetical protein